MSEPTKPLDEWTKPELYAEADRLQVRGRSGLGKAELFTAVKAALEAETAVDQGAQAQGQAPVQAQSAPGVTVADMQRITGASTQGLCEALEDDEFNEPQKVAIRVELEARGRSERRKAEHDRMTSKGPQRYRVTKAGITQVNGSVVDIPVGAIISDKSHKLSDLKAGGVEWEPCEGVKVVVDHFGRRSGVAKG